MKWKASFRKLTALLLSVVLMLSLCTTAFATEGDGGEPVCIHLEGCTDNAHAEGCPLHQDPDDTPEPTPPTCNHTVDCAAGEHEDGCPVPAVKEVQDLINQLPDANAITQSDAASLAEIGAKIEGLSQEQKNALKLDKYNAAKEAIDNLPSQDKTPAGPTPAESTPVEPTPAETLQQMIFNLATALSTLDPSKDTDIETAHNKVAEIYSYATENGLEINEDQEVAILTQLNRFYPTDTNDDILTPVAKIGETSYETLAAAVTDAETGDTITLLSDASGSGIIIDSSKLNGLTIDFNSHTYTVDNSTVGSTGTETQCFQILTGGSVTMKNGSIVANTMAARMMIQNYSNLTLENMTLDATKGTNSVGYVVSNNCGNTVISNSAITAKSAGVAFDVYGGFGNYGDVTVTVTGSSVINGTVEVDRGSSNANKNTLVINGGTFTGNIDVKNSSATNTSVSISNGTFSTDVSEYVVDGNKAVQNENGTYSIGVDTSEDSAAVAEFNGYGYTSVQAAINAAAAAGSGKVTLLKDTNEDVVIASGNITLNLNGNTLTNVSSDTIAVKIGATLTINGTGTVDNKTNAKAAIFNEGTVVLNGGTYDRTSETGESADISGGNSWYTICNHGAMTINSGVTVKNTGSFSSMIENGYYSYNGTNARNSYVAGTNAANPSLTINGGTFTGGLNTVKNDDGAVLEINGGTYTNTTQASILNWNVAKITGGTFESSAENCVLNGASSSNTSETNQGILEISGGSFKSTGAAIQNNFTTTDGVSISGGSFSSEVAKEYCADGFYPNKNADGTYSVHVHNYGEPVFTWTDDNTCTVTTTCETCGDTLTETCTVTKETIAATATEAEKTVYTATATINGKTVTDTKNGLAILAGQDQSYALYSGDTITIRCSGALGDFVSISVDGEAVDYSNYTVKSGSTVDGEAVASSNYTVVKSGSTVLTFSNSYLNTLSVGEHTVTMNYDNTEGVYTADSVSTTLTVTAGWEKLAIEVKANRTSVRPGKTITYTLTVTNNTGTDLTDIVVSNTVDKNLTFSSSSGSGTYTAKDGLWTISELKAGKTAKITVKYTVKSGVKDGTNLVYASAITSAEAANGETLPDNVSPSGSVTVKVSNKISLIPGTGDTSNIGLWITVLAVVFVALVAVGIIAIIKTRKKK